MTDRVKESLFNILGSRLGTPGRLEDLDVLDLFAGSGALGIESLSRGARSCVFVERDRAALRALRRNLSALELEPLSRVLAADVWSLALPDMPPAFDLIFMDPPFRDAENSLRLLDLLERLAPRLAPGGVLVLRCPARAELPLSRLRGLVCFDQREFGRMRVLLLARTGEYRSRTEEAAPAESAVG